jgi:hypothetical protein
MSKAKTKKRPPKAAPIKAVREMCGPAVVSMLADPDDAAARVACGWQPLGTSGEKIIIVADHEAMAAWAAKEGATDE